MTSKHDELMQNPEFKRLYAIEGLIADTAQMISDLLEKRRIKQADLARRLNKTPAFVSQLLNGKANMTVHTLAEVIFALEATVKISAQDLSASACEEVDESQMLTHRFSLTTRNDRSNFHWEDTSNTESGDYTSRTEYAA